MEKKANLVAVFVAAVVHFGLGAAWFTMFAKPWMAGLRMMPAEIQAAQQSPSPVPYFIAFLCNLVIAYALAWMLAQMATQGLLRGIAAGAVLGFAMAAAMITELAFEMRGSAFKLIAAGYPFVGAIIMGAIIGAWRKKGQSEFAVGAKA